jgi:hypothetical protein
MPILHIQIESPGPVHSHTVELRRRMFEVLGDAVLLGEYLLIAPNHPDDKEGTNFLTPES